MKKLIIGHISDTHNKHKQIKWPVPLETIDVLVHSGDISGIGLKSEVENFFKWFTALPVKHKILVAGNHDKSFDPLTNREYLEEGMLQLGVNWPMWLVRCIEEFNNASPGKNFYLENESIEIEGVKFWGSPVTPEFGYGWAFNSPRGSSIREFWKEIPLDTDVVITHGPPIFHNDLSENSQQYVGCVDLREIIKRVKPLLSLHGHIHEGYGYSYDADTHYFNGSICTLKGYEPTNLPWIIDTDFVEGKITILNDTDKGKEDKAD